MVIYKTHTGSPDDYIEAIDKLLKDTAVSYGYDSIHAACTYAASGVQKFRSEGIAFLAWRDAVWTNFNDAMTEASETGEYPDAEVFISQLPRLNHSS